MSTSFPRANAWALLVALTIGGCGIVPKKTDIAIHDLRPQVQAEAAWPRVESQLVVLRPNAERLIDSARILVRPIPGELQVYKGAVWAQPAPDMLQDAVVRALEDSRRLAGVTRRGGGIAGDYDLAMDIRRFDADYQGAASPHAVIEVSANLIHNADNRVVATRTFRASTPANGTAIAEVSQAFEQSMAQVTREIAGWTLSGMQRGR